MDPAAAVVVVPGEGLHVLPLDEDLLIPAYGHVPSVSCPCGPLEHRQQDDKNQRYMVYFHDFSYQVAVNVL